MKKSKALEIIEYGLVKFIFFIVSLLPRKTALKMGEALGGLAYVVKSLRKTVYKGLYIAFGDTKSEKEIKHLAKQTFRHWGKSAVEFLLLPKVKKHNRIDELVEGETVNNLIRSVLKRGKGCIIVSGHFGMWEYMAGSIGNAGIPLNVIMRPLDNKKLDTLVSGIRSSFGTKNIPKKQLKKMLRALKNNEALAFMIDQNSISKNSTFIPYFNTLASTSTGATWFLRHCKNTPVVAISSYRDKNNRHITSGRELKVIPADNYDDFARKNIAYFTRYIEEYVRLHPEQWLWLHPRWNKRPKEWQKDYYTKLAEEDAKTIDDSEKKQNLLK